MSGATHDTSRLSQRMERQEELFLRRYMLDRLAWDHGDTDFRDEYVRRFGKVDRGFEEAVRSTTDMVYSFETVPYLDREWLDHSWLRFDKTERIIDMDEVWAVYTETLDTMEDEKRKGTYVPYEFKRAISKEKGWANRKKGKKWVR